MALSGIGPSDSRKRSTSFRQATSFRRRSTPAAQLAALAPTASLLIAPDAAAKRSIGRNVLDPTRRAPSAEAGRRQAFRLVDAVTQVWSH